MRLSTITVSLCSLRRIRSRGLVGIVVREVVNHSCSTFCFVYLGVRGFIVVVVGQVGTRIKHCFYGAFIQVMCHQSLWTFKYRNNRYVLKYLWHVLRFK
jgi:hypothetical protein